MHSPSFQVPTRTAYLPGLGQTITGPEGEEVSAMRSDVKVPGCLPNLYAGSAVNREVDIVAGASQRACFNAHICLFYADCT